MKQTPKKVLAARRPTFEEQRKQGNLFCGTFVRRASNGLGLSLSYDIITRGHSGEIKVETTEGQGAKFIVRLPC